MPGFTGDLFDVACVAIAALLAFAAYRTRSRALILVATVVGVAVASGVLLFGFIAYPLLLGVAWKRRGRGYGWAFLLAAAMGTLLLAWRIEIPELMLGDATERATATVTRVRMRDRLWSTRRNQGQYVPKPYEEVAFDVATEDTRVLHLVDRVDSGSVAGLRVGGRVAVAHPPGAPSRARLAGATRDWSHAALLYTLASTWLIAGGLVLLAWLAGRTRRALAALTGQTRAAREGSQPESGRST
jgi:hypothetical protein